jgi:hypothetical protein
MHVSFPSRAMHPLPMSSRWTNIFKCSYHTAFISDACKKKKIWTFLVNESMWHVHVRSSDFIVNHPDFYIISQLCRAKAVILYRSRPRHYVYNFPDSPLIPTSIFRATLIAERNSQLLAVFTPTRLSLTHDLVSPELRSELRPAFWYQVLKYKFLRHKRH